MARPTTSNIFILNLFILFGLYLMQFESTNSAGQTTSAHITDEEVLAELNQGYLLAYSNGDAEWFDQHLSNDFTETAQDGTLLNKADFLEKISAISSSNVTTTSAEELSIRIVGDMAIVQAIPLRTLEDGSIIRGGRYLDIYYKFEGGWLCVVAQLGGASA